MTINRGKDSENSAVAKKIGRPKKVGPDEIACLIDILADSSHLPLEDMAKELEKRSGTKVCSVTIGNALRELGFERQKMLRQASQETGDITRYGYTERHRKEAKEGQYPSSLDDAEWTLVSDIFESQDAPGRPAQHSRREVLNACLYVLRTGCAWRQLPKDFPHWDNVYKTFRRWSSAGLFEQMHDRLRAQWRLEENRNIQPTSSVVDSQSNRLSPQGGVKGYDAGKKIKGRKRHLVTDTLGLLLAVTVTTASMADRDSLAGVFDQAMAKYPLIERLYADTGYRGPIAREAVEKHGVKVEILPNTTTRWVNPKQPDLFPDPVLPANGLLKRWVVERSHAWNERSRRLVMHHDRRLDVSESWVWLANAKILLSRLAHPA